MAPSLHCQETKKIPGESTESRRRVQVGNLACANRESNKFLAHDEYTTAFAICQALFGIHRPAPDIAYLSYTWGETVRWSRRTGRHSLQWSNFSSRACLKCLV